MESKKSVGTPQNVSTLEQANDSDVENLMKELKFLRNENTILKGRLRGIDTLGVLLQEARETNQRLCEQKDQLQQRLDDSFNEKQKSAIVSSGEVITSISDINQIYQPNTTETIDDIPALPAASDPVVEPTVNISVTASDIVSGNSTHTTSQNNLPVTSQATQSQPQVSMTENQVQPSDSIRSDDHDLQYDSDKFEEPSYPKIDIGSFSGPSFSDIGSSDLGMASSTFDDLQIQQSLPRQPQTEYDDLQIRSLCTSTGESLVNPEKMQYMMTRFVSDANKASEELKKYKNLYFIITNENGVIKKENTALQEENKKLLHRIRQLEHSRDNIETESLTQAVNKDWVHVSSNQVKKEEEVKRSVDYSNAVKQIKELKTANKAWQTKWDSLEKQYSSRNRSLEKEIDSLKSEIKRLIKTHEDNQLQADEMLMNAKKRVEEEEELKMAANDCLHKANQELKGMKMRVEELESELGDLKRDKSIVESELSILRNVGQERQNKDKNKDTSIAVLRQQITICTEDFERERQDRAAAQSARSALQEENNQLIEEKQNLTAQVNRMNRQLQDVEINCRRLESDNENHQSHIRTLKAESQRLRTQLQVTQQRQAQPKPHRIHSQVQNNTPTTRESLHLPNPISQHIQSVPAAHNITSRFPENQSLEHLPGAWTCNQCTYINFPGRTVCEICGSITENGYGSPQGLQPRGTFRDLEIDTCH